MDSCAQARLIEATELAHRWHANPWGPLSARVEAEPAPQCLTSESASQRRETRSDSRRDVEALATMQPPALG